MLNKIETRNEKKKKKKKTWKNIDRRVSFLFCPFSAARMRRLLLVKKKKKRKKDLITPLPSSEIERLRASPCPSSYTFKCDQCGFR